MTSCGLLSAWNKYRGCSSAVWRRPKQHPIKKYSSKVQLAGACYFPLLTALFAGARVTSDGSVARLGRPPASVSEFTVTLAALSCSLLDWRRASEKHFAEDVDKSSPRLSLGNRNEEKYISVLKRADDSDRTVCNVKHPNKAMVRKQITLNFFFFFTKCNWSFSNLRISSLRERWLLY